ncbi:MAG: hypothetical protein WD877_01410 [Candidatus Saccharimonadales bacterium]
MNQGRGESQPVGPSSEQAPLPQTPEQVPEQLEAAPAPAPEASPGKRPPQITPVTDGDDTTIAPPIIADDVDEATLAPEIDKLKAPTKEVDRIEKEWVDKAKAVVAQTQDDPHEQKHQMSKVKAAYVRQRFGKTIRTDEVAIS